MPGGRRKGRKPSSAGGIPTTAEPTADAGPKPEPADTTSIPVAVPPDPVATDPGSSSEPAPTIPPAAAAGEGATDAGAQKSGASRSHRRRGKKPPAGSSTTEAKDATSTDARVTLVARNRTRDEGAGIIPTLPLDDKVSPVTGDAPQDTLEGKDTTSTKALVTLVVRNRTSDEGAGIIPTLPLDDEVPPVTGDAPQDASAATATATTAGASKASKNRRRGKKKTGATGTDAGTGPTAAAENVQAVMPPIETVDVENNGAEPGTILDTAKAARAETTALPSAPAIPGDSQAGKSSTLAASAEPTTAASAKKRRKGKKPAKSAADTTAAGESGQGAAPTTDRAQDQRDEDRYHHFIPRLALRNFSPAPPQAKPDRNPRIHYYHLSTHNLHFDPVGNRYGNPSMYLDASASNKQHIEVALSKLERIASNIITRIKEALAKGDAMVTMTRTERNNLRKFLFVMRYRTQLIWGKYNRPLEQYDMADRSHVLKYMRRKGFTKPLEVWLHTLKTILDTHLDANKTWIQKIREECFEHDAAWFVFNMEESFMALCTPKSDDDEFILSECAFSIHEGPTEAPMAAYTKSDPSGMLDPLEFGRSRSSKYTEFHKLAPLAPNLLVVLRSNHLRGENKWMLKERAKFPGQEQWARKSIFDHLDLKPAMPSYGQVTPAEFKPKDDDKFTFKLHKLGHRDVRLFNSVILEEAKQGLTWRRDEAMVRTLREYLEDESCKLGAEFTLFTGALDTLPDVRRREALWILVRKLEQRMGAATVWTMPTLGSHFQGMDRLERSLAQNKFAKGYFQLGGTTTHFMRDFFQASIVSKMRIKVADALPNGEQHRLYCKGVMRNLFAFLSMLPSAVIYLHVKIWRILQDQRLKAVAAGLRMVDMFREESVDTLGWESFGAEDAVAQLATKIPKEHHSCLMLQASLRRVSQEQDRLQGYNGTELGSIEYWVWLESTALYDPQQRAYLLDPYREEWAPEAVILAEMRARCVAKMERVLEGKWGEEVASFVWEWLYAGPDED
ncbi:hypothetical protein BDZ91DRAFT_802688 [Kalaharituber pfeilii]|nr:hypothetical protein BDZ91DRAFT_802688 [Kalaharituber pfeilii]